MIGRLIWAGVAMVAALAAFGFTVTAATMLLADMFGLLEAAAIVAGALALLTLVAILFMLYAPWRDHHHNDDELLAVRLARDVVRKQPLSAVALFGAVGFAAARRPKEAAEVGRGVARLLLG